MAGCHRWTRWLLVSTETGLFLLDCLSKDPLLDLDLKFLFAQLLRLSGWACVRQEVKYEFYSTINSMPHATKLSTQ